MTHAPELGLVVRVGLDAQAGREDELGDRGAEAGEEGVEGLVEEYQVSIVSSMIGYVDPWLCLF